MDVFEDPALLSREELIRQNRQLIEQNRQLIEQVAGLLSEVSALRARVAELERRASRPAAPFSKNKRKENPKRPGRKPGQGKFSRREEPEPTEPVEQVPVSENRCQCGGELVADGTERVTRTYLPRVVPVVKAFDVEICRCSKCGRRVRGKHPEVAADQTGATAHRVDDAVYAMAHTLHYGLGVPVRKTPLVLQMALGIKITQSALTQDALGRAKTDLAWIYEQIREQMRQAPAVYTDDTGWRIGGELAFLMGFETDTATFYQIRHRHRHQEVLEALGEDFQGNLSTDRGASYDAKELAHIKMNKCAGHILKNISQLLESQRPAAQTLGCEIASVFRASIGLWHDLQAKRITPAVFECRGGKLYEELGRLLRRRSLRDPGNRKLVSELSWHYERGNLLRFLKDPSIEPTNNRAERVLRPAVIQRKVSHCSKNEAGAEATSKFSSVIQTCKKQGKQIVESLTQILHGNNPLAPPQSSG